MIRENWQKRLWGCWWLGWIGWSRFFIERCGLRVSDETRQKSQAYYDANRAAGWWWPHARFAVVCDRPAEIHREEIGPRGWGSHRLHRRDGPAVRYRDGWALYFLDGVRVDAAVVEQPDAITVAKIRDEPNEEIRRVLTRQFGPDTPGPRDEDYDGTLTFLRAVQARVVDADHGPAQSVGAGLRALVEDDAGERWVIATDGSTGKTYYMSAAPEDRTAAAAHVRASGIADESRIVMES